MAAGLGELFSFYFAQNGYLPIEEDNDSAASYSYYLYEDKYGNWYIQRRTNTSDVLASWRFAKGSSASSTAWTNRATQTYNTPFVIFKDL